MAKLTYEDRFEIDETTTLGQLCAHLDRTLEKMSDVREVRFSGPDKKHDTTQTLVEKGETWEILISCGVHWHDCLPKVRLFLRSYDQRGNARDLKYLWGCIVDDSGKEEEFDKAHDVARRLHGTLMW